jgi:FkbM family methyltransferase
MKEKYRHDAFDLKWLVRNSTDEAIIQEVCAQKVYGDTIKPGDKVIDIGAQLGSFTVFAASKGASVRSFEPDPDNYATMLENIALNDFQATVTPYNDAVWSNHGEITLYDSCSENLGAHSAIFARNANASVKVPAITLDEAMEGWDEVDFLKMDCEGSEFEIMKSDRVKDIKAFSMEVHGFVTNIEDYMKFRDRLAQWFDLREGVWHEVIFYLHGTRKNQ